MLCRFKDTQPRKTNRTIEYFEWPFGAYGVVRKGTMVRLVLYLPGCAGCHLGISPQAISSGMLRTPPVNLNKQAQEATVLLIREVLDRGITLSEVRFRNDISPAR